MSSPVKIPPRSRKPTWLVNASVITQNRERDYLPKASILIEDGVIAKIQERKPTGGDAKLIDCQGLVVLPGFVQTHIHLCQTLFRNLADDLELMDWLEQRIWPMEAAHTAASMRASAWLGIHELLTTGTTCILDMASVRHTSEVLKAATESGMRANIGKCLMDHPQTVPEGLLENSEESLRQAIQIFEKWNGLDQDRIRVSFAPRFALSCTQKLLEQVAHEARARDALIHTHASENLSEITMVQELTGLRNIEYLEKVGLTKNRLVLAHCIHLDDQEMGLLREHRIGVAHCPGSNLKLASGIARIPEMLHLGIPVGLGADGAPCNNQLNAFQEMRLASLIQKPKNGPTSLRAQEILDLATISGARVLHWEDQIGSIELGKQADLIAVDLHQTHCLVPKDLKDPVLSALVYAARGHEVAWTMVHGRIVARQGRLLYGPGSSLIEEAKKQQQKHLSRLSSLDIQ